MSVTTTTSQQADLEGSQASVVSVARGVAWRSITTYYRNPALVLPTVIFPLLFLASFGGSMQRLSKLPGFHYAPGFTTYIWSFNILQGGTVAGAFIGFALLRDFESGFMRRLFLGAQNRLGIVLGYCIVALTRTLTSLAIVTAVGLAVGARPANFWYFCIAVVLICLTGQAACLWGIGLATRMRTVQAGPLIQMPTFISFFLAPIFVPIDLLHGWLHTAALINPISRVIMGVRDLIEGSTERVPLAFAAVLLLDAALLIWAVRGVRSAERSGA